MGKVGAEAGGEAASGMRKASAWLGRAGLRGASALALALPQPPAGVRGSGDPAGRGMTLTAMVAGPVTANDPDSSGWGEGGGGA